MYMCVCVDNFGELLSCCKQWEIETEAYDYHVQNIYVYTIRIWHTVHYNVHYRIFSFAAGHDVQYICTFQHSKYCSVFSILWPSCTVHMYISIITQLTIPYFQFFGHNVQYTRTYRTRHTVQSFPFCCHHVQCICTFKNSTCSSAFSVLWPWCTSRTHVYITVEHDRLFSMFSSVAIMYNTYVHTF